VTAGPSTSLPELSSVVAAPPRLAR
jgi:hypothetical protein